MTFVMNTIDRLKHNKDIQTVAAVAANVADSFFGTIGSSSCSSNNLTNSFDFTTNNGCMSSPNGSILRPRSNSLLKINTSDAHITTSLSLTSTQSQPSNCIVKNIYKNIINYGSQSIGNMKKSNSEHQQKTESMNKESSGEESSLLKAVTASESAALAQISTTSCLIKNNLFCNFFNRKNNKTFIDPSELKRRLMEPLTNIFIILLDCRTKNEFNLNHIKESVHLNCRDKITRKRLQSRKLTVKDLISCEEIKSKLESGCNKADAITIVDTPNITENHNKLNDIVSLASISLKKSHNENDLTFSNEKAKLTYKMSAELSVSKELKFINGTKASESSQVQANEDEEAEDGDDKEDSSNNMIIIYDDTTSDLNDLQCESNPLKIVQENIEQSGYEKDCKILKGNLFSNCNY
jgi:hypothetical protein